MFEEKCHIPFLHVVYSASTITPMEEAGASMNLSMLLQSSQELFQYTEKESVVQLHLLSEHTTTTCAHCPPFPPQHPVLPACLPTVMS
jgi:hypothetical protein